MAEYLTYDNIGDQVENLIDDDAPDTRTVIDTEINNVLRELIAEVSRKSINPPRWLIDFDDSIDIKAPCKISGITIATPGVITVTAATLLAAGDIVSIYNIVGTTELNYRTFRVNSKPTTSSMQLIDLDNQTALDTSGFTAWSSGGDIIHRGVTLATTGKDVERVLYGSIPSQGRKLKPIDEQDLDKRPAWWEDTTSIPERIYHRKSYIDSTNPEINQILWFHGADKAYNDFRYWFEKRVPILSAAGDIPRIPHWAHIALVYGTLSRLAMFDIRVKVGPWDALYDGIVQNLISYGSSFVASGEVEPWGA
jgi:hypothetical protein